LIPYTAPPQASERGSLDKVPTDDDLLAELHDLTGLNATWSNVSYSNTSASSGNDISVLTDQNHMKHLKGWYRVDIRLGLHGTHVGTFAGERLYNRIYEVLKHCKPGGSMDDCSIRNVVYEGSGGEYRTDSTLYINVLVSTIHTTMKGLEDLTVSATILKVRTQRLTYEQYRMMARTFQKMTEVPSNCRWIKFSSGGGDRPLAFCSVASQVMIAFPINGGPVQSLLKLTLEWDHETDKKSYTCDEVAQSGTVMDYVSRPFLNDYNIRGGGREDSFKKEISKIYGWKENRIAPYTACLWDHCFNTVVRNALTEWIEVDDCEPAWNPIGCDPGAESRTNKDLNCPPEYRGTRSYTYGKVNSRDNPNDIHWNG
jgi:hypothetical protein